MAEVFLIAEKKFKNQPVGKGSVKSMYPAHALASCELQIIQMSWKQERLRGEDLDVAFRMYLKLKGSLHKLKRLSVVLELVIPSRAPWHCWEGQPGKASQPGKDRQTDRAEAADPHAEADTTLCWGPSTELLLSALRAFITFLHERSLRGD